MQNFQYPVTLTPDKKDGGFVVTFKDLPEAITQGETVADALRQAADCLEEAIANRMAMNAEIPEPGKASRGRRLVATPPLTAAKAALYQALRESGVSRVKLAQRLGCDEKEVRRLLDLRHHSRLSRIQGALAALGKELVIQVRDAA